ncbi:hypothetical protein [Helicobacter valdiviensis]|uniref:hypothetical protein n=1 Tax=Helicobacter valdiviensis TaxID=1458358 RepID=UPI0015EB7E22|nr:hypothetical protein [Helicobacter valdiviensis]
MISLETSLQSFKLYSIAKGVNGDNLYRFDKIGGIYVLQKGKFWLDVKKIVS